MDKLMNIIVDNPILAMTACAAVFGVILLFALILTMLSNSKTKKQMRLMVKALYNDQRPKIIPKFTTVDGRSRCLTFENIGGGYAKNVRIVLNKEWLDAKARINDFAENNMVLAELNSFNLFIARGDSISYGLYLAGTASYEIDVLRNQKLAVTITYNDALNQIYQESFELDLMAHEGTVSASDNEITQLVAEAIQKIDAIRPAIGKLEQVIAKIDPTLQSFGSGILSIEPALRVIGNSLSNLSTKTTEIIEIQKESLKITAKKPLK